MDPIMLLPLLLLSTLMTQSTVWYGPATAVFAAPPGGNPFDPEVNDVRAVFSGPHGEEETRLAYWSHGAWRAVLVAHDPGVYTARLIRNGEAVHGSPVKVRLKTRMPDGFVRVGGPWGFQMDSGKVYWPLGHDLGWHYEGQPSLPETLRAMKSYGVNWARIWACAWDGKNPWWKASGPYGLASLDETSLDQWADIVDAAQANGVYFQLVLFHHGEFTTHNDSNWDTNPWNVKNGGFLSSPADFFSNPRAVALSKAYVRYMVARYGYSPSIMSWELFNEVESVNAVRDKRIDEVKQWHDDMAAYIRSLDPYRHLVTSSSDLRLPIFGSMDYYQTHGYPSAIQARLASDNRTFDKVWFYGEIGDSVSGGARPDVERNAVRDSIWTSLFRHFAGASEYWYWDSVYKMKLQNEYADAHRIIEASDVLGERDLAFLTPDIQAGAAGDLIVQPSGWGNYNRLDFDLPKDASALSRQPASFQGVSHPEARSGPLVLHMDLPAAGEVKIRVIGVSASGANLVATVNGGTPVARTFIPAADFVATDVSVPVPAGHVDLKLDNTGADWVRISSFSFPGIGKPVEALGIGNRRMALMRLERHFSGAARPASVSGLPLADGRYRATLTDLDSGKDLTFGVEIKGGVSQGQFPLGANDAILLLGPVR
jgi:hypothetical protein